MASTFTFTSEGSAIYASLAYNWLRFGYDYIWSVYWRNYYLHQEDCWCGLPWSM